MSGTCEWILDDPKFESWLNSGSLWITGRAARGKTFLSIFITQELEKKEVTEPGTVVLYFFCDYSDPNRNNASSIVRGLLFQLLGKKPHLSKHATSYFGDAVDPRRKEGTLASLGTLWSIFVNMINDAELNHVYCLLDGLDECEAGSLTAFLRTISAIINERSTYFSTKVRLLGVSRDTPGLFFTPDSLLDLNNENSSQFGNDIDLYINAKLDVLQGIEDFADIREEVCYTLRAKCEGTFLFIGLVMHELEQQDNCTALQDVLEELPVGLSAYYGRMLKHIKRWKPARFEQCLQLLQWLATSIRPMTIRELVCALGYDNSAKRKSEGLVSDIVKHCGHLLRRLPKGRTILLHNRLRVARCHEMFLPGGARLCSVIIRSAQDTVKTPEESSRFHAKTVYDVEYHSNAFGSEESVALIHGSLREFLSGGASECQEVGYSFAINEEKAHIDVARRCLEYISACTLLQRSWVALNAPSVKQNYPFLFYAVTYWIWHAGRAKEASLELFDSSTPIFQETSAIRTNWFLSYLLELSDYEFATHYAVQRKELPLLQFACLFGFQPLVAKILNQIGAHPDSLAIINHSDEARQRPISYAIRWRHGSIVKELLEHGATVRFTDFMDGLWFFDSTIFSLLSRCGNVNTVGSDFAGTPLLNAAIMCNIQAIKTLMAKGASCRLSGLDGASVLDLAAHQTNREVVSELLLHIDDMNAILSAAKWATSGDRETGEEADGILICLLEKVPFEGYMGQFEHLFGRAIIQGLPKSVDWIIKKGHDPRIVSQNGTTALNLSIAHGHPNITEMLVSRDVALSNVTEINALALCHASSIGNDVGLKFLLENHIDPNQPSAKGHLGLLRAVKKTQIGCVKLLLQYGARVDEGKIKGKNALMIAARAGREEMVSMLSQKARTNVRSKKGRTALHHAGIGGHREIMLMLMKHGWDNNLRDKAGKTATQYLKNAPPKATKEGEILPRLAEKYDPAEITTCLHLHDYEED